jgi:AcrR family transcriptional regulator
VSVRDQILQATLDLCARRGIDATSLQDIADASNCSKANVVYHFSHKEELISEALTPALDATVDEEELTEMLTDAVTTMLMRHQHTVGVGN